MSDVTLCSPLKCETPQRSDVDEARQTSPCPTDAPGPRRSTPPDDKPPQSLRTESARRVLRARVGGGGPRGLLALAGQLQDSAKPSWSPISLALPFLWRNNPALRQKVQGKQDSVLGAIRRHCCQTRLGAAHELTAANASHKSNSFKPAAVCGKSIIHSYCYICLLGLFFLTAFFTWQVSVAGTNCAKKTKQTQLCETV